MIKQIHNEVETLKKRYHTNNPYEIADYLGIIIKFFDLNKLKGYYTISNKFRYIVINNNLDENLQKVICSHELGHDRLHRHYARYSSLQDLTIFDMTAKPERDANIFASDLLISDSEVLIYAKMSNYTDEQIANIMNVPTELIYFKTLSIVERGYDIKRSEYAKANFLGER